MKYIQFTDASKSVITSEFGNTQDPDVYQNQGEVEDDDPRYIAFIDSMTPSTSELAKAERDRLLQLAAIRIAPLQDALDLDDATAEEGALLKKWKQYRVALNRLDLYADPVQWPSQPE